MKKTKRGEQQGSQVDNFKDIVIMHAHRKMGNMRGYTKTAQDYIAENVLHTSWKSVQRKLDNPLELKVRELATIYNHFCDEEIITAINELIRMRTQSEQLSLLKKN